MLLLHCNFGQVMCFAHCSFLKVHCNLQVTYNTGNQFCSHSHSIYLFICFFDLVMQIGWMRLDVSFVKISFLSQWNFVIFT